MDPITIGVLSASIIAGLAAASWAGLKAWNGWLELKRFELTHAAGDRTLPPASSSARESRSTSLPFKRTTAAAPLTGGTSESFRAKAPPLSRSSLEHPERHPSRARRLGYVAGCRSHEGARKTTCSQR